MSACEVFPETIHVFVDAAPFGWHHGAGMSGRALTWYDIAPTELLQIDLAERDQHRRTSDKLAPVTLLLDV